MGIVDRPHGGDLQLKSGTAVRKKSPCPVGQGGPGDMPGKAKKSVPGWHWKNKKSVESKTGWIHGNLYGKVQEEKEKKKERKTIYSNRGLQDFSKEKETATERTNG